MTERTPMSPPKERHASHAATEDDYVDDFGHDLACTHCGGEGICDDNCDPLWYEPIHPCHACNGSGNRKDQVIF